MKKQGDGAFDWEDLVESVQLFLLGLFAVILVGVQPLLQSLLAIQEYPVRNNLQLLLHLLAGKEILLFPSNCSHLLVGYQSVHQIVDPSEESGLPLQTEGAKPKKELIHDLRRWLFTPHFE